ncbi:uncharacterized protein sS8_0763 [Methylocaldum marinum]|uniref:Uncharacterized protein n=1 Tax=Methylocaldum marinum TaxID=1432792 RepID=A0A250KMD5_9GAMM|nr:hypothetical protein [Methylocaldum marinum]BBA32728.1 uncharacterized protein sS8_0763 [Methylocaldum marinum]
MPIDPEDIRFIEEMVKQLDATIGELAERESALRNTIGSARVEEVRALWNQTLDRQEELELRRSLDWRERELLWLWTRQRRIHATRALAGQAVMRSPPKV